MKREALVPKKLWSCYDDIVTDSSFCSIGRTISEADLLMSVAIGGAFHQPIHTDLEFIQANTSFKERLLPGPIILYYGICLLSATLVYRDITIAFAGLDAVRAHLPVYPGDTITALANVKSKKLTSNSSRAIVVFAIEIVNQHKELVMSFDYSLMVHMDA